MKLLLVLLVPLVLGGGPRAPPDASVHDGTNDVSVAPAVGVVTPAPELDLTAAWFEADATNVVVRWQVQDARHRFQEDEIRSFFAHFGCGPDTFWVSTDVPGPSTVSVDHEDGTITGRVVPGGEDETSAYAILPRVLFGCAEIVELRTQSMLVAKTSERSWWGGGPVWIRDFAPDTGHGTPYRLS